MLASRIFRLALEITFLLKKLFLKIKIKSRGTLIRDPRVVFLDCQITSSVYDKDKIHFKFNETLGFLGPENAFVKSISYHILIF